MAKDASSEQPDDPSESDRLRSTRLETVAEICQAVESWQLQTTEVVGPEAPTQAFRPVRRPPMALLCILDDGRPDGEWVRLRGDRFVIGRGEGDLIIPHDTLLSGRHAELTRERKAGRHRWYLNDLRSTNGTYVRVGTALLKHNQELLLGSRRYRFHAASQGAGTVPAETAPAQQPKRTSDWEGITASDVIPALVELKARGEGQRFLLNQAENWIGHDSRDCTVVVANDPFVSARHARLFKDPKGRWHIENNKSLNGTWLRIARMPLDSSCQFQLGEQRFLLKLL